MSLAGEVIERARDAHAAFTRQQTPDGVALRFLVAARRTLHGFAVRARRRAFVVTTELPLTAADVATGLAVPPSLVIDQVRVRLDGETLTLPVLEAAHETAREGGPLYAVWDGQDFARLRLYPLASQDWARVTAVLVDRVPALPPIAALTDPIGLEDAADEALAAMVALSMGARGTPVREYLPLPMGMLRDAVEREQGAYLASLAEQRRSAVMQVSEGLR